MSKKNNDISIQLIRLLALLMIIFCHILQGIDNSLAYWFNLGVQIFLIISGFLYGDKDIDTLDFYKKRIVRILQPLIILIILVVVLEGKFLNITYPKMSIVSNILGFGGFFGKINSISNTWFVSYILLCYLITPILYKIFQQEKPIKLIIIFMLFLQLLQYFHVVNITIEWINCYILGYIYKKCFTVKKNRRKFEVFTLIATLVFLPLAIIYQENVNINLPNILTIHSKYIINYGHVFLGLLVFIVLYKLFKKARIRKTTLLDLSDKYSYYIYLVHQIFILHELSFLHFTNYLYVNIAIILVLSIASGIILYWLNKLFSKTYSYIYKIIIFKNKSTCK